MKKDTTTAKSHNSYFDIKTLKEINDSYLENKFDYQKPHRANYYKIFVITSGIGQHIIDLKKHNFRTGNFIFISKKQIHSYDFKPGNSGYIITFSEQYLIETVRSEKHLSDMWLFNYHFKKPVVQVVAKEQEYFVTIIERIFHEFNNKKGNREIIQTLLNLLLLNSERIKKEELRECSNEEYCNIFFNFKNYVENNFHKTRNAKVCAEELNISYKHLNNICKKLINKTAKQFIDDFIILETKRFLLSSEMSIKGISEQVGFDEPTNFIKYFKKHTNISPAKFRNKQL